MEETTIEEHGRSLAAPIIFMIVIAFQLLSRFIEQKKKKGSKSGVENQLRGEIKQLYKEASSFSQPSTFAQAAKLRRMAASKEKDLAKLQELHSKEMKLSYDSYSKGLTILKVFTFLSLICWFWRVPVAAISKQLVEPFGKVLSWRSGNPLNDNVMDGTIGCSSHKFLLARRNPSTVQELNEHFKNAYAKNPKIRYCNRKLLTGWDHTLVDFIYQGQ